MLKVKIPKGFGEKFNLDIASFISSSSFSDAGMRQTNHRNYIKTGKDLRPELLTSQDMYEKFEGGIRGGLGRCEKG